jgi:hypothetical protein
MLPLRAYQMTELGRNLFYDDVGSVVKVPALDGRRPTLTRSLFAGYNTLMRLYDRSDSTILNSEAFKQCITELDLGILHFVLSILG